MREKIDKIFIVICKEYLLFHTAGLLCTMLHLKVFMNISIAKFIYIRLDKALIKSIMIIF